MIGRLRDYFWTVRYLTLRQLVFRIWGPLRRRLPKRSVADATAAALRSVGLAVADIPVAWEGLRRSRGGTVACFLNLEERFTKGVEWSCMDHGLLWNYHLHYLNWLHRLGGEPEWIFHVYGQVGHGAGSSRDPYPTSLRLVSTVKAIAAGRLVPTPQAIALIQEDCVNLLGKLEYQIAANHLLENGFGLLWGGFFLEDEKFWKQGKTIVLTQLREQILEDGAHFERSPMYHATVLWRILDTINLLAGSADVESNRAILLRILRRHAAAMLCWSERMPYGQAGFHLNDSAPGMAPSTDELVAYATRLGVGASGGRGLGQSGFRTLGDSQGLFLVADVSTPGPEYQPGHAHAGTLGFCLSWKGEPILVDTGTSTYEKGERREYERSTAAHNTVSIGRFSSSEHWSGFRMARRARVTLIEDREDRIGAYHDGYRSRFAVRHRRSWSHQGDSILIADKLEGPGARRLSGTARFIVAPGVACRRVDAGRFAIGSITLSLTGALSIETEEVAVSAGFNLLQSTTAIRARFRESLSTEILSSRTQEP